jgi:hypothetical protein
MAKKKAYEENCVKLVLIKEGIYDLEEDLTITYAISIHGAGQDKTIFQGHGIKITCKGPKEEKKRVNMQGMTIKGSSGRGLDAFHGLSFLCTRMNFTQCKYYGVYAYNTKGRLINCVITQCGRHGIFCQWNGLIELEGDQTKVDGNVTSRRNGDYGLYTHSTSSTIHLLFPLTKESVSTNNNEGRNYGGHGGTIETVESF